MPKFRLFTIIITDKNSVHVGCCDFKCFPGEIFQSNWKFHAINFETIIAVSNSINASKRASIISTFVCKIIVNNSVR